jgi:PAS domain S-box-containing protein
MVSPLWLGNVLLASVLLLVPRKIWPVVLAAGLSGFFLYDLLAGGPIRSIVWLILSNAVEVVTAVLCLSSSFDGVPRLNSVKALANYSFFAVFLAPFAGAFLGALSSSEHYWASWKLAFFSEALGFLTLMPAVLGWATEIPTWAQKSRTYYSEAIALMVALVIFGHLALATPGSSPPALLYSLVPLLLWSTLRFGSTGVSTSMIAIAFVSIWGAVHHQGPFTGPGPLVNVLSLQLFLLFTAAPFMVLAAVVDESRDGERALRQRDRDLNEAQWLAHTGSWQWDPTTDTVTWSEELYRIVGRDPALPAIRYQEHSQLYTPESWKRLQQAVDEALRTGIAYELDLEMMCRDGTTKCLTARGEVQRNSSGRVVRLYGTVQDITERKLAEEALASVSRRLIDAQEQERTRIARELHDDIGQRVALLAVGLDQLQDDFPHLPIEARARVGELQRQTSDIATDTQSLSHELHSSRLELQGVAAAVRGFCKEFGEQQKVEIDFKTHDLPSHLAPDISLCLYRVLQEALHNSAKHSTVRNFEVQLWGTSHKVHLTVRDFGSGFDRTSAKKSRGLGLISMEERLKLVKGTFSIESQPNMGTTVRACIPLDPESDFVTATG